MKQPHDIIFARKTVSVLYCLSNKHLATCLINNIQYSTSSTSTKLKDELSKRYCTDGGQGEHVYSCIPCVFNKKVSGRIWYRKSGCVCVYVCMCVCVSKRKGRSVLNERKVWSRQRGQATGMSTS